ncbi:MAG: KEOPS complex subunit Pcc1 [Candidatus Methanospirareceae archaeon]
MRFEAEFVLEAEEGKEGEGEEETIKMVYESLKAEREEKKKRGAFVELRFKRNKLRLCLSSEDAVTLRAAANTWLRLCKIAVEMVLLVREQEEKE